MEQNNQQIPCKVDETNSSGSNYSGENDSYHIFVGDLAPNIEEELLLATFNLFGRVVECKIIKDMHTQKPKGYGFVAYKTKQEAEIAIQTMNGQLLGPRAIRTNWAVRRNPAEQAKDHRPLSYIEVFNASSTSNTTIYVGGITTGLNESLLRSAFKEFGEIKEVRIFKEKGFSFIRFDTHAAAARAIVTMHGQPVGEVACKCSWGKEPTHPLRGLPETSQLNLTEQKDNFAQKQNSTIQREYFRLPGWSTCSTLPACYRTTASFPLTGNTTLLQPLATHARALPYTQHIPCAIPNESHPTLQPDLTWSSFGPTIASKTGTQSLFVRSSTNAPALLDQHSRNPTNPSLFNGMLSNFPSTDSTGLKNLIELQPNRVNNMNLFTASSLQSPLSLNSTFLPSKMIENNVILSANNLHASAFNRFLTSDKCCANELEEEPMGSMLNMSNSYSPYAVPLRNTTFLPIIPWSIPDLSCSPAYRCGLISPESVQQVAHLTTFPGVSLLC